MSDKISTAIAGIGDISDIIKNKVSEVFSNANAASWTKELVYSSPFLLLKPRLSDYFDYIAILQDLNNLLQDDGYAIGIYYNFNTKNQEDIKFTIIHSLDQNNDMTITISHMPEQSDATVANLRTDSYLDFLKFFESEGYALGLFVLLNTADLYPTFTIKDFNTTPETERTYSLRDLISYIYCVYPNPVIHTQKYALNIFGLRSNWGYEKDNNDSDRWKYKKRLHFRDWLIIFYIGDDNKWVVRQFPLTTLRSNSFSDSYRDINLPNGFFIMPKGQNINIYKKGIHYGSNGAQHQCLKQKTKIYHYRDKSDKSDLYYDFDNSVQPGFILTGDDCSHVNIHSTHYSPSNSASQIHESKTYGSEIGGYSLGCQTVPTASHADWGCSDNQTNAESFMQLVKNQIDNCVDSESGSFLKDEFTYTVLESWDFIEYVENYLINKLY